MADYLKLFVLVNQNILKKHQKIETDVQEEMNRINKANMDLLPKVEPLVVNDLFKEFNQGGKNFVAVDHLAFGVKRSECFG